MCTDDAQCAMTADFYAANFSPLPDPAPRRLVSATCQRTSDCGSLERVCSCEIARGDAGPDPLLLGGAGCALLGRLPGCLWPQAELPLCQPGTCDCPNACKHAIALLEADDARPLQGHARAAKCVAGSCRYVISVDDRCYAELPVRESLEVDCSQPDEVLLQRAPAPRSGSCSDAYVTACRVDPGGTNGGLVDPDVASCP
jgi:hypothetical protein